jgi:alkylation response protein AidB-like acyl-CoA dehydrogenase
MRRTLFDDDHDAFRESFRAFLDKEVVPHQVEWDAAGIVPRELFTTAGRHGFLGMDVPEEHGGGGVRDFRFNAVIAEEVMRCGAAAAGLGISLHNDICLPYFLAYCNEEQQARWLPGIASGELITAIAMTEPGIGSDLASMSTTARRDGEHYVVNGAKTFITNGINADLVITAVKTDPSQRHKGICLLVLERGMPDEGQGFTQLVTNLPQERLSIAIAGVAAARTALEQTLGYVKERRAFGQPVGSFQNSRFVLAELATEIDIAEHYTDDCVRALNAGELTAIDAAKAKWWCTELQGRVVDRCLQLHGGYGYMNEYPIARAFTDARITRIYGGTTEIMKEVIGRSLGL